jgi:hypothetical protein
MDRIVLSYKREENLSTGAVTIEEVGVGPRELFEFSKMSFSSMIGLFASHLQQHPDAGAVILRTDREGLQPYHVNGDLLFMLRTDPVTAIRMLDAPEVTVRVRDVKELVDISDCIKTVPLPAGADTLAQTFGDEVYIRRRGTGGLTEVECPCCGHWARALFDETPRGRRILVACGGCARFHVSFLGSSWAGVQTSEILHLNKDRYFLPREWNANGNWVTHKDLTSLFEQWNQEKSS